MVDPLSPPLLGPPLSPLFGSYLSVTLAKTFPLLVLSFLICTGQESLGASLSSAIRSGPELVNSRTGCPPQLVKGSRVAGGPLWQRAGARVRPLSQAEGVGRGRCRFLIQEEAFSSPQSPRGRVGDRAGWGRWAEQ